MFEVIIEGDRIDHADASESQPLLLFQVGDFLGESEAQFVPTALQKTGVEERGDRIGTDRTVSDAPARSRHLDHRLKPVEST